VISRPFLGWNVAISRRTDLPPPPVRFTRGWPRGGFRALLWLANTVRFSARSPMPDAREGLQLLAQRRSVVIVTGRSELARGLTESWLRRHGLMPFVSQLRCNGTDLGSAHFKLVVLREYAIVEHVDDDGATALLLAREGIRRVYLRDWRRNRGLPYPANVVRVSTLPAIVECLE
jgi:uncharacterized HAD superfamily protein